MNLRASVRKLRFVVMTFGLMAAACGDKFGESVTIAPAQQQRVSQHLRGERMLTVPQDTPFRVTETLRQSTGSGRAEATVDASGSAQCEVTAGTDGTATAQFQLGHVIRNDTEEATNVTIQPAIDFTHEWSVDPVAEGEDDALALKLVVNDSEGITHARIALAAKEDRYGPPRLAAQQRPELDVTMQPNVSYRILLAGRATLSKSPQNSDETRRVALIVKRYNLEIRRQ